MFFAKLPFFNFDTLKTVKLNKETSLFFFLGKISTSKVRCLFKRKQNLHTRLQMLFF